MATRGRPLAPITVSDEDREVLVRLSKRPTAPHGIATRARIVLLSSEGLSNTEVAQRVGVDQATVRKWRERYRAGGIDALSDEPRPGVPRTFGDDAIEALIVKTLTEKPRDATHWSTRDMAKATGMSQPTSGRGAQGRRSDRRRQLASGDLAGSAASPVRT
jgi:transposase